MLGIVLQVADGISVDPSLAVTLLVLIFGAGSAVGGWIAYIAAGRRFRQETKERLGEVEETGGPTVREKLGAIEAMLDRHERYFEMLMPRALEQDGVLKVHHRDEHGEDG